MLCPVVSCLCPALPAADPHPGNVAVDAQGRLIYYDFGMTGSIPGGVKGGLMELFYGVYEKDADRWGRVCRMGVFREHADMAVVSVCVKRGGRGDSHASMPLALATHTCERAVHVHTPSSLLLLCACVCCVQVP